MIVSETFVCLLYYTVGRRIKLIPNSTAHSFTTLGTSSLSDYFGKCKSFIHLFLINKINLTE